MLSPLIHRSRSGTKANSNEHGFTMALVAVALVSLIAMAALSLDIGTLYQAKAEAQRAADAAALAAARVISISGITGDPTNQSFSWQTICAGETSPASLAAFTIAEQNLIGGRAASTVKVYYGTNAGVGTSEDCSASNRSFGINPIVQVYVQQAKLPTFFARVFSLIPGGTSSNSGVSATATAEAFNPSNSGNLAGNTIPVQPRCVKPLVIPNIDRNQINNIVDPTAGTINNPGVSQLKGGVIGESFYLTADCSLGAPNCQGGNMLSSPNPPQWTTTGSGVTALEYIPALTSGNPGAVPSCSPSTGFQAEIAGCDQTTVYSCGTPSGAQADLGENPAGPTGHTSTSLACLTQSTNGADTLNTTSFPFQIQAGAGNPLVQQKIVKTNDTITTSNSIITFPIYDGAPLTGGIHPDITIVGFLQVFINFVDTAGNINVTVLNVAGCTNNAISAPVSGSSPVPVRLITAPPTGP
jgi:Flp pilus assembly protein TadG